MADAVDYPRFKQLTSGSEASLSASELHGLIVGHACAGGVLSAASLWPALRLPPGSRELEQALLQLHRDCLAHLAAGDMTLTPLLPADDASLRERVDALRDWVRGFLGGFGLAGVTPAALAADGHEALHDLGVIAAAHVDLDDEERGTLEDENAHAELLEFVRVAALLLHADLMARSRPSGQRKH